MTAQQIQLANPVAFDEDLATRCFPHKFRRLGDPLGYLDEIGIEPILEFIYKGNLLIDVAEATDVPLLRLRKWVEDRGHFQAVEEAETQSADGYLANARQAILNSKTAFQLSQAKELFKYAQFMAENKNKHVYGGGVAKQKNAPVKYEFIIGNPADAPATISAVIDAESRRIAKEQTSNTPTTVSLGALFPNLNTMPEFIPPIAQALTLSHLEQMDSAEPVLVASRPVVPTARKPDIGPFYDDPTDVENKELPEYYL